MTTYKKYDDLDHPWDAGRAPATLPLPLSEPQPFTRAMAIEAGLNDTRLCTLVRQGVLRRPLHGVYAHASIVETFDFRLACLALVVPPDCVVTDRSAGWLHGAPMILAPGAHLRAPRVSVFRPPGRGRMRRSVTRSGERTLADDEVLDLGPIRATTPVRTALDLGRLLPRAQALSGLDMMLRVEAFTHYELLGQVERLRGQRGVRQLRALAPIADRRSQSPGESALRLAWYDAGLPTPELQIPVDVPGGGTFFLDLGREELRFGAEYDGVEFHTSPEQRRHDRHRRALLVEHSGWHLEIFVAEHVYGVRANAIERLKAGFEAARRAMPTSPPTNL